MTNDQFLAALARLDPAAGLVDYVKEIKPYHTKILDVLVEYVFTEPVNVTIFENWCWDIQQFTVGPSLTPEEQSQQLASMYTTTCNYGSLFNPEPYTPATLLTILEARQDPVLSVGDTNEFANTFLVTPELTTPFQFVVDQLNSSTLKFVAPLPPGQWLLGFAVKVYPTAPGDVLPAPLNITDTYYYIPLPAPNQFALSKVRYPTQQSDYIRLLDVGTGVSFSVEKNETLFPGAEITVSGSAGPLNAGVPINDAVYTVYKVIPEGANYRVQVMQDVPWPPLDTVIWPATAGGIITYNDYGGFDTPQVCFPATASSLWTQSYLTERLVIEVNVNNGACVETHTITEVSEVVDPLGSPCTTSIIEPIPPELLAENPGGFDVDPYDNL